VNGHGRQSLLAVGLSVILAAPSMAAVNAVDIERGRYLVQVGDCASCHTDSGGKPFAGGRAIPTPFGTIYSRNITPDEQTGLGQWTNADFYRAMHEGTSRNGEHLYPAFPYPWYTKMNRADVDAIKAYLGTLDPVYQRIAPNVLTWPLGWRGWMGVWNSLYFTPGEFEPRLGKSSTWNRGAYLVEGPGHCSACHSPKNIAGAVKKGEAFEGGDGEGWFAADLTGRALDGLTSWSDADVAAYLQKGVNAHSRALGPMAQVVETSTSHLNDADAQAIATYLKDLPGEAQARAPVVASAAPSDTGRGLYIDNCTGCHMQGGAGQPGIFPPLKGSAIAQGVDPSTAIQLILVGASSAKTERDPNRFAMPAFAEKLSDREIAQLLSYVRAAWGNRAPAITPGAVARVRDELRDQTTAAK
jgi:mono/diheme cytochrome c family protein